MKRASGVLNNNPWTFDNYFDKTAYIQLKGHTYHQGFTKSKIYHAFDLLCMTTVAST